MSALKLIKSALSKGNEHVGDLVWWSLSDARLDRETFIAIWNDASLPGELLPEPPSADKAFKAAVKEAQVGQPGRLLRLAVETETEIVYGVVREDRHGDGTLAYNQEARITLARDRDCVTSDIPGHDIAIDVKRRFEVLKSTHVPDDVRRTLVRALETFAAVSLRPSGGVYWCPSQFATQVRQLQSAIQRIGHSTVSVLPVHRSEEAEQTLGAVARGSIEDELAVLRAEIDGFVLAPPERAGTLERRLEAFDQLRGRARLYRDVLRVEVDTLDHQLGQLAATVTQLINSKAKAA